MLLTFRMRCYLIVSANLQTSYFCNLFLSVSSSLLSAIDLYLIVLFKAYPQVLLIPFG